MPPYLIKTLINYSCFEMKKKFSLSVSDFALPAPKSGGIDTYSGISEGQNMGVQIHKEIQARRERQYPSYQSEIPVKQEFQYKKYLFEVRGRMDGIYRNEKVVIEEIKSGFNLNKLHQYVKNNQEVHPYCLQLKTYGYIHWLKTDEVPELNLHLVSSRNKKSIDVSLPFDIKTYEKWLEKRLDDLAAEVRAAEARIKRRETAAKQFVFPFAKPRQGQLELMETVEEGLKSNQPMLIQAPTGLGKTIGILYPALQESMRRGQKTIYLTPKNSQHIVALEAVKRIQENTNTISSMTITAKNKICFKAQPICNSEYCEFAKDYYTKVTEHKLLDKLKEESNLTVETFKKIGVEYKVCPFELQMDNIANVDTIICDYNYVFSPHSSSNRLGKIFIGEKEKPNLIIDEIHNLPSRAMDYYSPVLSIFTLKEMILSLDKVNIKFRDKFQSLLSESSLIIEACCLPNISHPHRIESPIKIFKEQEAKIREFLAEYLESDVEITSADIVLDFCNYWIEFTAALEFVNNDRSEFFVSFYPKELAIKITCCDASAMLVSSYDYYAKIIGFSATLKPFDFYSQLTGLYSKNVKTAEFFSPFQKSKRKLVIIPQLSSKYADRTRNYPRIAEAIKKITDLKPGNYFIFFPSFEFLAQVLKAFPSSDIFKLIIQKRNMSQYDVRDVLLQLRDVSLSHLIFAVQGGAFSEGVDYPGDMIIGAFIVGTPLPMFDWEREQMRIYYEEKYHAGFEYAYVYPAMAKSIQASGRVIRSELDKGIIVLMDHRFLYENYAKCMPHDWYESEPHEMISNSILNDIEQFWDESQGIMAPAEAGTLVIS
jgi:DNA excision repair protein ERCC-2